MSCDASRARKLLGWQARTALDDGLARTIDSYRAELTPVAPALAR
jgi:nucleoside-diphosphate-sugar epimerase